MYTKNTRFHPAATATDGKAIIYARTTYTRHSPRLSATDQHTVAVGFLILTLEENQRCLCAPA